MLIKRTYFLMRLFLFSRICFLIFIIQAVGTTQQNIAKDLDSLSIQWKENGFPYIQNFSPTDYNAEIQNFSIIQDKRGLIYFGNNKGVLVYDGIYLAFNSYT